MPTQRPDAAPAPSPLCDAEAVRRLARRSEPDPESGCLLWKGAIRPNGYGSIGYDGKVWLAHRLAYYGHRGPIPSGYHVCHRCDTRRCVAIGHLFLGTAQENVRDMIRKGRARWRTRLRPAQVIAIKQRLIAGEFVTPIAREFGMTYGAVLSIRDGRTWRHIRVPGETRSRMPSAKGEHIPIIRFARWLEER